jgi:hypothetical protein
MRMVGYERVSPARQDASGLGIEGSGRRSTGSSRAGAER